jgi:hypothetical protein
MTQQIDAHSEKEKLKVEKEKLIKEIYRLKLHIKASFLVSPLNCCS